MEINEWDLNEVKGKEDSKNTAAESAEDGAKLALAPAVRARSDELIAKAKARAAQAERAEATSKAAEARAAKRDLTPAQQLALDLARARRQGTLAKAMEWNRLTPIQVERILAGFDMGAAVAKIAARKAPGEVTADQVVPAVDPGAGDQTAEVPTSEAGPAPFAATERACYTCGHVDTLFDCKRMDGAHCESWLLKGSQRFAKPDDQEVPTP